jgi:hypothetical protein
MTLKAENKNPTAMNNNNPAVGTHMARLVGLVQLGHQPSFIYQGNDIPSAHKIEFVYELPRSRNDDDRPHWASEEVKVSNFEGPSGGISSTMMKRVRSLDPQNYSKDGNDLSILLGNPCMVTIQEGKNGYTRMVGGGAVSAAPIGMEIPDLENDTFIFEIENPDMDVWDRISNFTKSKIHKCLDFETSELFKKLETIPNF